MIQFEQKHQSKRELLFKAKDTWRREMGKDVEESDCITIMVGFYKILI